MMPAFSQAAPRHVSAESLVHAGACLHLGDINERLQRRRLKSPRSRKAMVAAKRADVYCDALSAIIQRCVPYPVDQARLQQQVDELRETVQGWCVALTYTGLRTYENAVRKRTPGRPAQGVLAATWRQAAALLVRERRISNYRLSCIPSAWRFAATSRDSSHRTSSSPAGMTSNLNACRQPVVAPCLDV
jgi:hypothetical protein